MLHDSAFQPRAAQTGIQLISTSLWRAWRGSCEKERSYNYSPGKTLGYMCVIECVYTWEFVLMCLLRPRLCVSGCPYEILFCVVLFACSAFCEYRGWPHSLSLFASMMKQSLNSAGYSPKWEIIPLALRRKYNKAKFLCEETTKETKRKTC